MRFFLRLFGISFFLFPLLLVALVFFSFEQQPLVAKTIALNHIDVARARKVISNNDPRKLREGQQKSVTVSAQDLSAALNYLRAQFIKGGIETTISGQAINIYATAILPTNPIGKYLNLKLTLVPDQQNLAIDQFVIGKVPIPGILVKKAFSIYANSSQAQQFASVTNMLQSAQVNQNRLQLNYVWSKDALKQAQGLMVTQQDKDTLLAYQQQLAVITQPFSRSRKYSLTVLMEPLFRYAAKRSASHDPVLENRALITVLAAYANGQSLKRLTGTEGAKAKKLKLVLQNRHDFVQHFTISAGLSASGGSVLADAVGLYKEYEDRKGGGSGFSFTDLAADRAGVRLGKLATASNASARRIQQLMSHQLTEFVYMPKARDLPEGLSAAAFQRKYQGGSDPEYQRVIDLIEKRVDGLLIN